MGSATTPVAPQRAAVGRAATTALPRLCASLLPCLLASALLLAACDSAEPEATALVVESVLAAGAPAAAVTVRETGALDAPYAPEGVAGAVVQLTVEPPGGVAGEIAYVQASPGRYEPLAGSPYADALPPGATFRLDVATPGGERAEASGRIPPPIALRSLDLSIPDAPVSTVVLDSLALNLDSLAVGTEFGFAYLVEATLTWTDGADQPGGDSLWVQARLDPTSESASTVLRFFLLPEDVRREDRHTLLPGGTRTWTGVYAVPVEAEDEPLPPHRLRVALARSYRDYADYVATRNVPTRREPVSNVRGGVGLVAAIALDTASVAVRPPE
jgi:hypothetical protein